MKLVYKYSSDTINVEFLDDVITTVLDNFKKLKPYNIVIANIYTESKFIGKICFLEEYDYKNTLIDKNTCDTKYINYNSQEYQTLSCDRCGKTYLYNKDLDIYYDSFIGCPCYSPDTYINSNTTYCDDVINWVFLNTLDINIEYYVYLY